MALPPLYVVSPCTTRVPLALSGTASFGRHTLFSTPPSTRKGGKRKTAVTRSNLHADGQRHGGRDYKKVNERVLTVGKERERRERGGWNGMGGGGGGEAEKRNRRRNQ